MAATTSSSPLIYATNVGMPYRAPHTCNTFPKYKFHDDNNCDELFNICIYLFIDVFLYILSYFFPEHTYTMYNIYIPIFLHLPQ